MTFVLRSWLTFAATGVTVALFIRGAELLLCPMSLGGESRLEARRLASLLLTCVLLAMPFLVAWVIGRREVPTIRHLVRGPAGVSLLAMSILVLLMSARWLTETPDRAMIWFGSGILLSCATGTLMTRGRRGGGGNGSPALLASLAALLCPMILLPAVQVIEASAACIGAADFPMMTIYFIGYGTGAPLVSYGLARVIGVARRPAH